MVNLLYNIDITQSELSGLRGDGSREPILSKGCMINSNHRAGHAPSLLPQSLALVATTKLSPEGRNACVAS